MRLFDQESVSAGAKGKSVGALAIRMLALRRWLTSALVAGALAAAVAPVLAQATGEDPPVDPAEAARQERLMKRYDRMIDFNLKSVQALEPSALDAKMAEFADLALHERIAAWADYFWERRITTYRHGLKEGGYVREGRLVDDFRTDCVLFVYRVTELGRSSSALEAVQFAFGTRFYGATLEEVVSEDGRVDYDNPVHIDYGIEMIRSGIWGRDVTDTLGTTVADPDGSGRFPPGSISFVPQASLQYERLRDGDIVYFVTDPETPGGARTREAGAIIGHMGVIKVERGIPYLFHAASDPIEGVYAGGQVEKVRLDVYLERVETFKGIMATRITSF